MRTPSRPPSPPPPPPCAACGQPAAPGGCTNLWCRRPGRLWTVAFSVGVHSGPLRSALLAYKYREQRWRAAGFARMLAGWLVAHQAWVEEFDVLVPVPAYLGPAARRLWDPIGEIFAATATLLGPLWDTAPHAVVKTAETPAMTGLPRSRRLAVAEGPLRAALEVPVPAAVSGARVIVVDDVLTDGSTLREMARVLLGAGAVEVAGLSITRPAWSSRRRASPPAPWSSQAAPGP